MQKSELRSIYLEKFSNLSAGERTQKSLQIANNFFADFDLTQVQSFHCFVPIKKNNEIDTALIFERIWWNFPQIRAYAPRLNFTTGELESVAFTGETELQQNKWQIAEPIGEMRAAPREIDMIVTPLLCFDERGYRVGYGKGFYDRFLAKCRPDVKKIGISYFPPVKEITNTDEFDIKLDHCITPDRLYSFH